jgi:hypothetical protein
MSHTNTKRARDVHAYLPMLTNDVNVVSNVFVDPKLRFGIDFCRGSMILLSFCEVSEKRRKIMQHSHVHFHPFPPNVVKATIFSPNA